MYIIVCILYRNFYKKEKINSQLLVQKTILLYFFLLIGLQLFLDRLLYLAWIVIYLLMLSLSSLSRIADFLIVQLDGQYTVFKFIWKATFQLP